MDLKTIVPTTDCRKTMWNTIPHHGDIQYPDWRMAGPSPSVLYLSEADCAQTALNEIMCRAFLLPQTSTFDHFGKTTLANASWCRVGDDPIDRSLYLSVTDVGFLSPAMLNKIEESFFSKFPTWRILIESYYCDETLNDALTLYPNACRFELRVETGTAGRDLVAEWCQKVRLELRECHHFLASMWWSLADIVAGPGFKDQEFPRIVSTACGWPRGSDVVFLWIAIDRESDVSLGVVHPDSWGNVDLYCGVDEDQTLRFGTRFARWGLRAIEIEPQFATGTLVVEIDGSERVLNYSLSAA